MNKQDSKNMFLNNLWSNPYMHNSCLGISPKYLIFRNAPKPVIDLYGISFLCNNFETFTIFSAIVLIDCTYLPYHLSEGKGIVNRRRFHKSLKCFSIPEDSKS